MTEKEKVSRRNYVKYAGAGIVIVAGAAAGAYVSIPRQPTTTTAATTTSAATTTGPKPITGGTMVVEWMGNANTVDPAFAWYQEEGEAVFNLYQTLIAYKDGVGEATIIPFLAESYDISADGLKYTFKIRKGVKFSNGDPLNAYCFWHSFYRVGLAGQAPSFLLTVGLGDSFWEKDGVTAEMLNEWTNTDNTPPTDQVDLVKDPRLHIYCPDPDTLVLRLDKVFSGFLATLTQPHSSALSPRWVTENGKIEAGQPHTYLTLHAMGTGPFMLASLEPNIQTVFKKDPNYWGGPGTGIHDPAKLDKIIIKVVPEDSTRLNDLERGVTQAINLTPELLEQAQKPGLYVPEIGVLPNIQYIGLNCQKSPFDNKLIRNAVVRSVDYDGIISLFHGTGEKWMMPVPKGIPGGDPSIPFYQRDLDQAKRLLKEAGHPDGQDIPELRLTFQTDVPMIPRISEIVQANLADIGLKVKLEGLTTPATVAFIAGVKDGTDPRYPDLMYNYWAWYPDPYAYVDWFVTKAGFYSTGNVAWYSVPQIEDLVSKANSATSQEERLKDYYEVDRIVYEDAPFIPVVQWKNAFVRGVPVLSEKVQGVTANVGAWQWNFPPMYLVE